MGVIEAVRRKREELVRVLKEYDGIREIVEELYPDIAHFIYELLQNAEDAGASWARFALTERSLSFEHDGRPFEQRDIEAITNIGKGTKAGVDNKIGRFGIGFKSVFAYSETPHIWSPTFSFKISELVLPDRLDQEPNLGNNTRFEFPFNNPKKNPATAFAEIKAGLYALAETTLLFLTHLELITWRIGDEISCDLAREKHSDYHFEVLKMVGEGPPTSSHFLKFDRSVEGLANQRSAVAFELGFLPGVEQFDREKPLAKQLKIVPAARGQVAVFFPAEKETSGLRFHLHAPFVPELSRASIKETPTNLPLFQQLASLSAASLHQIRDLGLLTADFLAVLPNPLDRLPVRYVGIRDSIVEAMNSELLTPMQSGGHAPACRLLQAKPSLKRLLTPDDLKFLMDRPCHWAIAATQNHSDIDRFLVGLKIERWDVEAFVTLLREKTSDGLIWRSSTSEYTRGPDADFMGWLASQSQEWHQRLYSLLYTEKGSIVSRHELSSRRIIRLDDGNYASGGTCYFPGDAWEHDDALPRVDATVYTSGKSKLDQENARKFLEEIGVREVSEVEQVRAILKQRYRNAHDKQQIPELKRFIALLEKQPECSRMFAPYYILKGVDKRWHKPAEVFLDKPFRDTGLSVYYNATACSDQPVALAKEYHNSNIPASSIGKFAEAVGAKITLIPTRVRCRDNPQWAYLESVKGERITAGSIDEDYTINEIEDLLADPSHDLSKLIWRTMQDLEPRYLKATYQKSEKWGFRTADSQLVHHLRKAEWIPQADGKFVRPAEADSTQLPSGFVFDPGSEWLKAIHFGLNEVKRGEMRQVRQSHAKALGLPSDDASLDRIRRISALPADEQERFLTKMEAKNSIGLPQKSPPDPVRRAGIVKRQAQDAPVKESETKSRSVSIGQNAVKDDAKEYLRDQYTRDGVMICQICKGPGPLPFKLDGGADYFEKVEILDELRRRHRENYLALCPSHSAMYQYANGSSHQALKESILALRTKPDVQGSYELGIVLAKKATTIHFTGTHVMDLKAVIAGELEKSPSNSAT